MTTTRVSMQFDADFVIDSWESFTLRDAFTDPLGDFSFVARPPRAKVDAYRERLRKGELVTVFADEANQGTMLITTVDTTIGRDGVTFQVSCKTPLVTPYEGSVDPRLSLSTKVDVPVTDAVLSALRPYGFTTIIGDSAASVDAITGRPIGQRRAPIVVDALKHGDAKAQESETAYAFCARIFSRLGVALRCAVDGTLLITAPDYDQEPAYTLVQSFTGGAPRGDVMLSDPPIVVHDSNDGQFATCTVRGTQPDRDGQARTAEPKTEVRASSVLPSRSAYRSPIVAPHKPKFIKDKNARDTARSQSVAKLALGLRAVDAFSVSCSVDGFRSATGRVWAVDTIAHVFIEAAGIDEPMWISERMLEQTRGGGQRTSLKLIPKGALVLGDLPSGA